MVDYALINQRVYEGDAEAVKRLVTQAQDEGRDLIEIWSEGLVEGIAVAGEDMKCGLITHDEILAATRAMIAGLSALRGWSKIKDPAGALEEYRRKPN